MARSKAVLYSPDRELYVHTNPTGQYFYGSSKQFKVKEALLVEKAVHPRP